MFKIRDGLSLGATVVIDSNGNITTNAATATQLATSRSLTLDGSVTGTVSTNFSGTTTITTSLSNTGVSQGTYKSVTVGTDGRITAGTNPTTLAGYGITDAPLVSLAALDTTQGIVAQTGNSTFAKRTLAVGSGLSITNATGASGNPTVSLDAGLASIAALTGAGVLTATSTDTFAMRGIGTASSTDIPDRAAADIRYAPFLHTNHAISDVAGLQTALDGKLALAGGTMTGSLILAGSPSTALEAATKAYVDSVVGGMDIKTSARAATTANITLAGTQTIDGVLLVINDRVLVKNQTASSQNGIYTCLSGSWTRVTDLNSWVQFPGAFLFVEEGTINGDTGWVCSVDAGGTLGDTAVAFNLFAGVGTYTAGTGLTLNGTQFALTGEALAANNINTTGFVRRTGTNTWSASAIANGDLPTSGVTAATYRSVTVNAQGIITAGTNPTTIAGYGLVDAASLGANTFTGNQIISNAAAATLTLSGETTNLISYTNNGIGAPTFTTRSAGAKIVLYQALAGAAADYAFGIEASTLWSGVPTTSQQFRWYGGTTLAATLTGTGTLTLVGDLAAVNLSGAGASITALNASNLASGTVAAARMPALTGDITTSAGAVATTLATVNSNVGTYGSATQTGSFTVNAKGLITAASNITVTPAWSSVTSKPTTLSGYSITGSDVLNTLLTVDGAGSALDADLLDGQHGAFYAPIASPTFTGSVTLAADPTNPLHAATKQYVDNSLQGLAPKQSVHIATTANITLSGTQTIDGVAVLAGDRVLVKDQSSALQNGIYVCAAGAWARAADASTWAELVSAFTFVEEGTTQGDTGWTCTVNAGGTLETTAVTWVQFSGSATFTASTGIVKSGIDFQLTGQALALHNLGSSGIIARTGAGTVSARTITSASTGALTIADGDGVSGNPTLTVDAGLVSIAGLTGAGVLTATGTDTFAMRTIGVSGSTDIPDRAAADTRYLQLSGGTLTGNVTMAKATPILAFNDTAQVAPATVGLFRIYSAAGNLYVTRNTSTARDFATETSVMVLNGTSGVANFTTGPFVGANQIWHAGNHGASSTLDADLLDGQQGSFYQSAANLNAGTLLAARMPALTGDITTSVGAVATTLATVNSNVGSFGSATAAITLTVNAKGLITAASAATITPAWSSVTSKPTTLSGYSVTAADVLATLITVDGASSGLDADLLDGQQGSFYAPIASPTFTGTVTLAADPVSALQAATKQYVDNLVQGLAPKDSVRVATTANITLSGTQTIDGVAVIASDRVLVKNQSSALQNGIYVCAAGAWARASDANAWAEFISAFTFVEEGSTQADTGWTCTVNGGGTLETTAITWTQFSGSATFTASTGITKSGVDFQLTGQALALHNLSTTGVIARTGASTYETRSIGVAASTDIPDRAAADTRYATLSGATYTGNVGIGTSPASRLQINYSNPVSVPTAGSGGHAIAAGAAGYGAAIGALTNGNVYLQATRWDASATNYNLLLQPNGGSVGIGTTTPLSLFHAAGTATFGAGNQGTFVGSSAVNIHSSSGNVASLTIWQNGVASSQFGHKANDTNLYVTNDYAGAGLGYAATSIALTSGGDVGIGTTSPAHKLDVAGTFRHTGVITNAAGIKTYSVTTANQGNVNSTYEIMRVSRDPLNWSNQLPYEITVYPRYYGSGGKTVWLLTYGYDSAGTLSCIDARGAQKFRVYLGAEVTVNANVAYRPVFVDIPNYYDVAIEVKFNTNVVTSITDESQVHFTGTMAVGTGTLYSGDIHLVPDGGNVGIGELSPSKKLVVAGQGTGRMLVGDVGFGDGYTGLSMNGVLSTTNYNLLGSPGQNHLWINRATGGNIHFREGNSDQVTIQATTGNLGVGTTDASRKLTVVNDGSTTLVSAFQSGASGAPLTIGGSSTAGRIQAYTNAYSTTAPLLLNPDGGYVGIGTTAPDGTLTVFNSATFNARTSGINVHRPSAYGQFGSMAYDGDTTYFSSTYTGGGSGQGGAFRFLSYDNGGSPADRLFIARATGFVGIGTISPSSLLHVYNSTADNTAGKTTLYLTENNTDESSGSLNVAKPHYGIGFKRLWSGSGATDIAGIYAYGSSGYRGGLVFKTNNVGSLGSTPATLALTLQPDGTAVFSSTTLTAGGNTVWHAGNDGSGSGLDADFLDGYNSSEFARLNNHVTFADVTASRIYTADNYTQSVLNPTMDMASWFGASTTTLSGIVTDRFAFTPPTTATWSTDGTNFSSITIPTGIFKGMISNQWGGFDIPSNVQKVRFTWSPLGYIFIDNFIAACSTNGNSIRFIFEKSETGSTWLPHYTSSWGSCWPGYITHKMTGTPSSTYPHFRITIERTADNSNNVTIGGMSLMTDYGGSSPLYSWDASKIITFAATPTVNGSGVWHSGNDGASSGLDADLLDGIQGSAFLQLGGSTQDVTVRKRFISSAGTSAGDIYANSYLNSALEVYNGDGNRAAYMSFHITGIAGVTWGLNTNAWLATNAAGMQINGNKVVHAGDFSNTNSAGVAADTLVKNGISYVTGISLLGQTDGALYSQAYSADWQHQIFGDYRTGQIAIRGKNAGSWQSWRTVWDSSNDGAGSGLDADLWDGNQFASYLNQAVLTSSSPTFANVTATNFLGAATRSGNLYSTRDAPSSSLQYWQADALGLTEAPNSDWHNTIRMGHGDPLTYYSSTLAIRMTGSGVGDIYTQSIQNGTRQGWKKYWNDGNDGSGSGLDADLLKGKTIAEAATADTIVSRNGVGRFSAIGIDFLGSSVGDLVNNSPWYGVGKSDITTFGGGGNVIQMAGYYGIRLRSPNALMDFYQDGRIVTAVPAGKDFRVDGIVNATRGIIDYSKDDNSSRPARLLIPEGGTRVGSAGSETGAIKIELPAAVYQANSMHTFTVCIYEYTTGRTRRILCGGYNYSYWVYTSAIQQTESGGNINVRFGRQSSRDCVWIGETNTVWNYVQVWIEDVNCGYSGFTNAWATGWAVSLVTSFGTVENTHVAYAQWHGGNDGAGSGLDADLLDGYSTSTANEAVNTIPVRNASGYLSQRVIQNVGPGTADGMYIGYANSGSGVTRIYGGGSSNVSMRIGSTYPVWWDGTTEQRLWYNGGIENGVWHKSADGVNRFNFSSSSTTFFSSPDNYVWRNYTDTTILSMTSGGTLAAAGDITAYSSDERLKENVREIEDPLGKIDQISGYLFDWKKELVDELGFTPYQYADEHGFLAQEIQKIMPDAVRPAPFNESYLTVKYERLVPLAIQGIKALKEENEELRNELTTLRQEHDDLIALLKIKGVI